MLFNHVAELLIVCSVSRQDACFSMRPLSYCSGPASLVPSEPKLMTCDGPLYHLLGNGHQLEAVLIRVVVMAAVNFKVERAVEVGCC